MTTQNEAPGGRDRGQAKDGDLAGGQISKSQAPDPAPVKPGTQLARIYTTTRRDSLAVVGRGADALDLAIVNRDLHSERARCERDIVTRMAHGVLARRFAERAERLTVTRGGG